MFLASSSRPVRMKKPRKDIKVSRPQFLMYPVEKWGKPAAKDTIGSIIPTVGGNKADLEKEESKSVLQRVLIKACAHIGVRSYRRALI